MQVGPIFGLYKIPGNSLHAKHFASGPMERRELLVAGLGFCQLNSGASVNIQAEDTAP